MSGSSEIPVTLMDWRPMARNSLRGFATVRLGRALIIHDVAVHNSKGRPWAQLPSKPQIAGDTVIKDQATGKVKYIRILEWADRDMSDKFSAAVVAAIETAHPGHLR